MMMRLSTKGRYGLRLLYDICRHGESGPVRICDVAERQGISVKYLEKLIVPLKEAELVVSKRGPKGGHALSRSAEEILLGDVVRLLEGEMACDECVINGDKCLNAKECVVRRAWMEAAGAMFEKLNSLSLADLVHKERHCLTRAKGKITG